MGNEATIEEKEDRWFRKDTAMRTVERRFYVDKLKGLNRHFYVDGGSMFHGVISTLLLIILVRK
jgi:hypothetical protein